MKQRGSTAAARCNNGNPHVHDSVGALGWWRRRWSLAATADVERGAACGEAEAMKSMYAAHMHACGVAAYRLAACFGAKQSSAYACAAVQRHTRRRRRT